MLDKIEVIDECDKLGDRFNDEDTIQKVSLADASVDIPSFFGIRLIRLARG